MHRDPEIDGCTFQPKLFTNPNKTRKLCEARVKSMESRNEMYQQSIQLIDPTRKIEKRMQKIASAVSFSSPGNKIRSYQLHKKNEKSFGLRNYLKQFKSKQNNIQGSNVQSPNENFNKHMSPQSSSKDERSDEYIRNKSPLGALNQIVEKSNKRNNKRHMNVMKKNGNFLLPYKHNYSGKETERTQGIF